LTGKEGEDLASAYLVRRGYRIVERNFKCVYGEIDLIAWEGKTLVFVEVKSRSSAKFGGPEGAVNLRKQMKISRVAADFLTTKKCWDSPCRFDVVSIVNEAKKPSVTLFKNAFEAALPELAL
jgi:putative endonuclease